MQADGKILAGGQFSNIGGQTRNLFARLTNDTAALQNLAVTQTSITWTRGGSSPQFTRVTFEYSNDNVTYHSPGQRHGGRQQLDPDRFELSDRTELLHPRSRLLSQRLPKRVGEHDGISAKCFSEWHTDADPNCNTNTHSHAYSYAYTDSYADTNSNTYTNPSLDAYAKSDPDGNPNTDCTPTRLQQRRPPRRRHQRRLRRRSQQRRQPRGPRRLTNIDPNPFTCAHTHPDPANCLAL